MSAKDNRQANQAQPSQPVEDLPSEPAVETLPPPVESTEPTVAVVEPVADMPVPEEAVVDTPVIAQPAQPNEPVVVDTKPEVAKAAPVVKVVDGDVYYLEVKSMLDLYADAVALNKPVPKEKFIQCQRTMWKGLVHFIETTPPEAFNSMWSKLLMYFHEANSKAPRGVFRPTALFRYQGFMTWRDEEFKAHNNLFNILVTTADPASRATSIAAITLSSLSSLSLSEKAAERISNFYSSYR